MIRRTAPLRRALLSIPIVAGAGLLVAAVSAPLSASASSAPQASGSVPLHSLVQAGRTFTAQEVHGPGSHASRPLQSLEPCTFNGAQDTVANVTAGSTITVICSGFIPNEQVAMGEESPLVLSVDEAQGLNEIDANAIQLATANASGDVNAPFVVPNPFSAPDPAATCPPTQIQENSGLLTCALLVVDSSGNFSGAALDYAGQASPQPAGYQEVASDGGLFSFGPPFYGSMGGKPLAKPIVGMAFDPDTGGYWEVASDGGIFSFGGAGFYGSEGGKPLAKPIVGIAADPLTGGYWEVASDGGIFAFNAPFDGSEGGQPLAKPVVGMAFDPDSGGYWEVASDGGIFSFGGALFSGSEGGQPLVKPIVAMAADPATGGYWEVASDGGLFSFDAPFQGSEGGKPLVKPIVGMAPALVE
jgi:hypothetical protein